MLCDYSQCKFVCKLREGCSHVAAILFKVESAMRHGYTSTTSNLCCWNQVFKDKVKSYCVCNYYVVEFKKEHYFFSFSMSPLKSLKLIFQSQEIPQRVLPLHLVCRYQKEKGHPTSNTKGIAMFLKGLQTLFPQSDS